MTHVIANKFGESKIQFWRVQKEFEAPNAYQTENTRSFKKNDEPDVFFDYAYLKKVRIFRKCLINQLLINKPKSAVTGR